MNYRFEISLPTSSDFRCEIAVGVDQTFLQFHNKIVEVLGYDDSQIASFYTIDKMGSRVKEIALMDMASGEETEYLVMDSTKIEDIINARCIELEYVYDFFNNKYFKVEYAGEYIADSADVLPVCLYCDGNIPEQSSYSVDDKWDPDNKDGDYDESFMEEFSNDYEEEDEYRDEEEGFGGDDEGGDEKYDDRYESIDDYIDKL